MVPSQRGRFAEKVTSGEAETMSVSLEESNWDDPRKIRELIPLALDELKQIAGAKLHGWQNSESLTPTVLVHELALRFIKELGDEVSLTNRRHFLNLAARKMHHILIDRKRSRDAQKHGGGQLHVPLDFDLPVDLAAKDGSDLYDALDELEKAHPDRAEVIRCIYLLGLSVAATAENLEMTVSKTLRARRLGLDWLEKRLK